MIKLTPEQLQALDAPEHPQSLSIPVRGKSTCSSGARSTS
jgi:hypothetical protein